MPCSLARAGLEKQLSFEKGTRTNLEKETNELRKKITLLEYDLQEALQSQKRASNLKERADTEVGTAMRHNYDQNTFRVFLKRFIWEKHQ